ncbi:MAG: ABC transporter permease [Nanoarchaeota archaeon]
MFEKLKAIIEKEIKLNFRYKFNYLGMSLSSSLRLMFFFLLIYFGIFSLGVRDIGGISHNNYIPFLLLGGLISSFLGFGYDLFNIKFQNEKYWQTIEAFLIAPVNKFNLLLGIGFSEIIRLTIIFLIIILITYLFLPASIISILIISIISMITYIGILGISLIKGFFRLTNENYLFLIDYFFFIWIFFSCLYYPITLFPDYIQKIILLNPIYHSVTLIRELWYGSITSSIFINHFLYILGFSIISPLIGIYLFNKTINIGIKGY